MECLRHGLRHGRHARIVPAITSASRTRQPRQPIEVRRAQALDAALELIAEHGYGAVTMEAVARRCGFAKTVVYNAYPDREALLTALLQREVASGVRVLGGDGDEPVADAADPIAPALHWVERVVSAVEGKTTAWRLLLAPTDELPPSVREAVDAAKAVAVQHIRTLIVPWLEERPHLVGIDADMLARSLYAVCEQGTRLMLDEPEEFPKERVLAFARDFLGALVR